MKEIKPPFEKVTPVFLPPDSDIGSISERSPSAHGIESAYKSTCADLKTLVCWAPLKQLPWRWEERKTLLLPWIVRHCNECIGELNCNVHILHTSPAHCCPVHVLVLSTEAQLLFHMFQWLLVSILKASTWAYGGMWTFHLNHLQRHARTNKYWCVLVFVLHVLTLQPHWYWSVCGQCFLLFHQDYISILAVLQQLRYNVL